MRYTREQAKEAIMRLSMCARKECLMCKYKDRPIAELPSDDCKKRATKNMNILADICMCSVPITDKKRPFQKKETLCWKCAKNCGRCSWSENFTPVENWEAIPTKIKDYYNRGHIDSYKVISCPEFELSERYHKR